MRSVFKWNAFQWFSQFYNSLESMQVVFAQTLLLLAIARLLLYNLSLIQYWRVFAIARQALLNSGLGAGTFPGIGSLLIPYFAVHSVHLLKFVRREFLGSGLMVELDSAAQVGDVFHLD